MQTLSRKQQAVISPYIVPSASARPNSTRHLCFQNTNVSAHERSSRCTSFTGVLIHLSEAISWLATKRAQIFKRWQHSLRVSLCVDIYTLKCQYFSVPSPYTCFVLSSRVYSPPRWQTLLLLVGALSCSRLSRLSAVQMFQTEAQCRLIEKFLKFSGPCLLKKKYVPYFYHIGHTYSHLDLVLALQLFFPIFE